MRRVCAIATLFLCGWLAAGCSTGKLIIVKGKLTYQKQQLQIPAGGSLTLIFIPEHKGKAYDTYPTPYHSADGSFEVIGKEAKGIPLGKYRVTAQIMAPDPADWVQEFNSRFDESNTPVTVEITDEEPIALDLPGPP